MKILLFDKFYNTNESIVSRIIKLLDSDSNYLGIFKFKDALKKARENLMDLIEISKKDEFSICKIIRYSKFYYLEEKKFEVKKEIKKKRVKEMKFHLFIANVDYLNKIGHIRKFLTKGSSVKTHLLIRGREAIKMNIIQQTVDRIIASLIDKGNLLKYPNLKEKCITMFFFPKNPCLK